MTRRPAEVLTLRDSDRERMEHASACNRAADYLIRHPGGDLAAAVKHASQLREIVRSPVAGAARARTHAATGEVATGGATTGRHPRRQARWRGLGDAGAKAVEAMVACIFSKGKGAAMKGYTPASRGIRRSSATTSTGGRALFYRRALHMTTCPLTRTKESLYES